MTLEHRFDVGAACGPAVLSVLSHLTTILPTSVGLGLPLRLPANRVM
jgi:hypothetical protein